MTRTWWPAGVALALAMHAPGAQADAAALLARHEQLREALRTNPYQRPLHIESSQTVDRLRGEIHAVLDHPFTQVRDALAAPANWCDILILPFNTKHCRVAGTPQAPQLLLRIGRKYDQPPEKAFKLAFTFAPQAATSDYFETLMQADEGPLSTRDYRIVAAAVPLPGGRTFLRLDYTYGYGMAGRLAMGTYLATVGASKVGFSSARDEATGREVLIGGMRGAIERNAMRYYLAIDAYLNSLSVPANQRVEHRINGWFEASERYPRQLHEMDKATYVALKRGEIARLGEVVR